VLFLQHRGILSQYISGIVGGGGYLGGTVPTFSVTQYAFGAGWTTGKVYAFGSFSLTSPTTIGTATVTSTGGVAGSTISLVSPLAIYNKYTGFPFRRIVEPGIARLALNLTVACGNNLVEPGETCDDGGVAAGDGCSATCQVEAGYECTGAPSTCTLLGAPVTAVKLIVVDRGANGAKAVFVAKDAAITKGAGTSTATIGVTLDVAYDNGTDPASAGQFVAAAGSTNWLVNKSTVAKYVNKTAPTGGGTKVVVVKPGKLVKVVGKNLGDTPINILSQGGAATGAANTAACIDNGPDSNCFCSEFATCSWKSIGGGTGAKLVCKTGTGDAICAALP
jgi:cysteine-rich repeat protein